MEKTLKQLIDIANTIRNTDSEDRIIELEKIGMEVISRTAKHFLTAINFPTPTTHESIDQYV